MLRRNSIPWSLTLVAVLALGLAACAEGDDEPIEKEDAGATLADSQGGKSACTSVEQCAEVAKTAGPCQKAVCNTTTGNCELGPKPDFAACDDGDICTTGDFCRSGQCTGNAIACDDENPCTEDACDAEAGCTHTNLLGACDDGNVCTRNDTCTEGACKGEPIPECQCVTAADCVEFEDDNLCNGTMVCVESTCKVDENTIVRCEAAADPCREVACVPATGACESKSLPDNTTCNDQNACTREDRCAAGVCTGIERDCGDGDDCTADLCDMETGECVHDIAKDAPCDDDNPCTENDLCNAEGQCKGTMGACPCTETAECSTFDDGDLCNGSLACIDSTCQIDPATVKQCTDDPAKPCKVSECEPTTGECVEKNALEGSECDDGDPATESDHCAAGECKGTLRDCDDQNPCTDDEVVPGVGCENTPNTESCNDNNPCTEGDACSEGECKGAVIEGCGPCEQDEDCATLEDDDLCNGRLSCIEGKCSVAPATVKDCSGVEHGPCQEVRCVPETGLCEVTPIADGQICDAGTACVTGATCRQGRCAGEQLTCDDGEVCTDDICDPVIGCRNVPNTAECDDTNPCTTDDVCAEGKCTGTPIENCVCAADEDCDDQDDGNACNGRLKCVENKCVVAPETVVECDTSADGPCELTSCNPVTGACDTNRFPDNKPCNDSDACTIAESCTQGLCAAAMTINCDDGNACTDDSCDPAFGCTFTPNEKPCDDGNACTGGDTCAGGVCQPGTEGLCGICKPFRNLNCGEQVSWGTFLVGATDNIDIYPGCSENVRTGPELTYQLTAPYDGRLKAALSNEGSITDVFILEGGETGCDPAGCLAGDPATAEAFIDAGKTYFIVVDSEHVEGQLSAYTLTLDCTPAAEADCTDGVDEDLDGKTDCVDEDCSQTEACPPPACIPRWNLSCGQVDRWHTTFDFLGATDVLSTYSCDEIERTGQEFAYSFVPPHDGEVTFRILDETTTELGLLLLDAGLDETGTVCDPGTCQVATEAGIGNDLTWTVTKGNSYRVVVDAPDEKVGSYTLEVDCGEYSCDDRQDNDNNGRVDCADPDCVGNPACPESTADLPIPGDLVITEVMGNPADPVNDERGEWIELTNVSGRPLRLAGLSLSLASWSDGESPPALPTGSAVLTQEVDAAYPGRTILGRSADFQGNGGIVVDIIYGGDIRVTNNKHVRLRLISAQSTDIIDEIIIPQGTFQGIGNGRSWQLHIPAEGELNATYNDDPTKWCRAPDNAVVSYAPNNFGTPGDVNPVCPPVQ